MEGPRNPQGGKDAQWRESRGRAAAALAFFLVASIAALSLAANADVSVRYPIEQALARIGGHPEKVIVLSSADGCSCSSEHNLSLGSDPGKVAKGEDQATNEGAGPEKEKP